MEPPSMDIITRWFVLVSTVWLTIVVILSLVLLLHLSFSSKGAQVKIDFAERIPLIIDPETGDVGIVSKAEGMTLIEFETTLQKFKRKTGEKE